MRTRNGLCYPKREDAAHVSCRHHRRKRPREEDAATGGKRLRRAAGVDMFEALPDDLVVAVLCKLGAGAASPADLIIPGAADSRSYRDRANNEQGLN